ncbi:MAG: pantoate--beta-alanine ligase [Rhizobiales bacterium]|nr:pantoate--beta-alanine ligase [Hyphomicrobiales bacterium]MBI3673515.1 pantoate--beta-alanine ligase [Hyphomicrobiales bacterium]
MTPQIVRTIAELRKETAQWRAAGLAQAVVPTMGALHEGHLALVREGLSRAPRVTATIFVNPKQFAPHEDLGRYPRDEAGDVAKLGAAGAHLVFAPPPSQIYPPGFATTVSLAGPATVGLEDRSRPQFFAGVATIVAKLFIETGADFAMFGEKDYQQLKVVTRMARDLDIAIEVVGIPTIREPDGLAMSSRNAYLSAEERQRATAIYRTLREAAKKIGRGEPPKTVTEASAAALTAGGFRVDYVAVRNAETLAGPSQVGEPLRLLAAAWLGKTRLIDNIAV